MSIKDLNNRVASFMLMSLALSSVALAGSGDLGSPITTIPSVNKIDTLSPLYAVPTGPSIEGITPINALYAVPRDPVIPTVNTLPVDVLPTPSVTPVAPAISLYAVPQTPVINPADYNIALYAVPSDPVIQPTIPTVSLYAAPTEPIPVPEPTPTISLYAAPADPNPVVGRPLYAVPSLPIIRRRGDSANNSAGSGYTPINATYTYTEQSPVTSVDSAHIQQMYQGAVVEFNKTNQVNSTKTDSGDVRTPVNYVQPTIIPIYYTTDQTK